ncbi:MAG: DUF445 domain-containing protein, partial [Methylocystaceae bacterium]
IIISNLIVFLGMRNKMWLKMLLIPLISAAIGYVTNVVAVKMLFHPRKPVRFLFWEVQGVLPRRQVDLARTVGEVVEKELFSVSDLLDQVNTPEMQETLVSTVVGLVKQRLDEVMPRFVPNGVTGKLGDLVEVVLRREAPGIVQAAIDNGREQMLNQIQVGRLIEEKIGQYQVADAEQLVLQVASRELRFIEIMGGVLGLLIGILQDVIILFVGI